MFHLNPVRVDMSFLVLLPDKVSLFCDPFGPNDLPNVVGPYGFDD